MKTVKVYTMDYCPYCDRAKALLSSRNIAYTEEKIDPQVESQWKALEKRSGMKTMPQIFIGEECIGGFTELAELDRTGDLKSKLE